MGTRISFAAMERIFSVVLVPQPEGGYFVQCPSLPGCYSQGESVEESMANIREAIELALEYLTAEGKPIPSGDGALMAQVRVAG